MRPAASTQVPASNTVHSRMRVVLCQHAAQRQLRVRCKAHAAGAQAAALDLLAAAALQPAARRAAAAAPGLGARLAAAAVALLGAAGSAAAAAALLGNLFMDPALRCQARPRSTSYRSVAPRGNQCSLITLLTLLTFQCSSSLLTFHPPTFWRRRLGNVTGLSGARGGRRSLPAPLPAWWARWWPPRPRRPRPCPHARTRMRPQQPRRRPCSTC
jgi:hypothetical protein